MSKRYLGGDIYFEQNENSQEFSEEESSGSSTLSGLTDVDISNPSDGQTLVFNATSGKWENGAGGGLLVNVTEDNGVWSADKTVREILAAIENGSVLFRRVEEETPGEYIAYKFGRIDSMEVAIDNGATIYSFYFLPGTNNTPFIYNRVLFGTLDSYPSSGAGEVES